MYPQAQLGGFPRRLPEGLRLEPALPELGEGDLARVRVDVFAAYQVGGDRGEEPFCVLLAGERPRVLAAVEVEVARLPAFPRP